MNINKTKTPISKILKEWYKYNFDTFYQRNDGLWAKKDVLLLIDSIVRGFDIPKFYIHKRDSGQHDVVDGQQRMTSIKSFLEDSKYSKDRFNLGEDNIGKIREFIVDLSIFPPEFTDRQVKDLFLRLQKGKTLNSAEQRRSFEGNFPLVAYELAKDDVFKLVTENNNRYKHEELATRLMIFTVFKGAADNNKSKIDQFYKDHDTMTLDDPRVKECQKYMRRMCDIFRGSKVADTKMSTWEFICMFICTIHFTNEYAIKDLEYSIGESFADLLLYMQQAKEGGLANESILHFAETAPKTGTDTKERLDPILGFMMQYFIVKLDILPRDDRNYNFDQRRAIYIRDNSECKITGRKISFSEMDADHKTSKARGGEATLENGQATDYSVNRSLGAK